MAESLKEIPSTLEFGAWPLGNKYRQDQAGLTTFPSFANWLAVHRTEPSVSRALKEGKVLMLSELSSRSLLFCFVFFPFFTRGHALLQKIKRIFPVSLLLSHYPDPGT